MKKTLKNIFILSIVLIISLQINVTNANGDFGDLFNELNIEENSNSSFNNNEYLDYTYRENIGGGIEAVQKKLYTYFYYNGVLMNTIKNKIKDDKYLIFGNNYNGNWGNKYLIGYYLKRKLSLYSAYEKNGAVYFSKKTDYGIKEYIYYPNTGKWNKYYTLKKIISQDTILKGKFIKYIGGGIEARQSKMYTYFYYNGKLINTVKNKIKNDGELIYGNNIFYSPSDYLSEYYAKRKLELYYAIKKGDIIFFSKKTDYNTKSFIYNTSTGKWEY